jgi:hypothetical protein
VNDIEAIKQLKARYFRTMDTNTESGGSVVTGADTFMTFLRETLADVVTVHHGHTPEIELTSATTATGVWAMDDMLRWPTGMELHGFGHYHETYQKVDGRWRIKTTTLTRLRMDFKEGAPE